MMQGPDPIGLWEVRSELLHEKTEAENKYMVQFLGSGNIFVAVVQLLSCV